MIPTSNNSEILPGVTTRSAPVVFLEFYRGSTGSIPEIFPIVYESIHGILSGVTTGRIPGILSAPTSNNPRILQKVTPGSIPGTLPVCTTSKPGILPGVPTSSLLVVILEFYWKSLSVACR